MSTVPPEYGSGQPEQPQLDPSGQWQWDAQQQQWVPSAAAQAAQAAHAQAPAAQAPAAETPVSQESAAAQGYQPTAEQPSFAAQQPAYGTDPTFSQPTQPGQFSQPGQAYAPMAGGPVYGPPAGGKPKSRKLLWIALAVVVIVVAGVVVGVLALSGSSSPKADKTVTTYLDDLANGDSKGAIAQGSTTPPSATFLTDDILKQQQAKSKISNIKVISTDTSGNDARVHVTYQFGSRSADENFELAKSGGKWKLTQSTYPIDVSDLSDIPSTTLFGKPIANLSKVYVFPGPVVWGTSNKYFTVTDKNADKFALSPYDTQDGFSELTADLSSAGKTAAQTAVTTFFAKCAQSKQLSPSGCPQEEFGDTDDTGEPVDGTVTWTAPTDLSGLQYQTGSDATKLDVQGTTVWSDTYQSKAFTDDSLSTITDANNKTQDSGTVDLSQSPPVFTEG